MTNKLFWQGNLLVNDKKELIAGVIKKANDFTVIAFRSHCYMGFDGFQTVQAAKAFAERAGGLL